MYFQPALGFAEALQISEVFLIYQNNFYGGLKHPLCKAGLNLALRNLKNYSECGLGYDKLVCLYHACAMNGGLNQEKGDK